MRDGWLVWGGRNGSERTERTECSNAGLTVLQGRHRNEQNEWDGTCRSNGTNGTNRSIPTQVLSAPSPPPSGAGSSKIHPIQEYSLTRTPHAYAHSFPLSLEWPHFVITSIGISSVPATGGYVHCARTSAGGGSHAVKLSFDTCLLMEIATLCQHIQPQTRVGTRDRSGIGAPHTLTCAHHTRESPFPQVLQQR